MDIAAAAARNRADATQHIADVVDPAIAAVAAATATVADAAAAGIAAIAAAAVSVPVSSSVIDPLRHPLA